MEHDSRIVVTTDKTFYNDGEEITIHFWLNESFTSLPSIMIISPLSDIVTHMKIGMDLKSTETLVFQCGGPKMIVNGDYIVRVCCGDVCSDTMFEYYSKYNRKKYLKGYV